MAAAFGAAALVAGVLAAAPQTAAQAAAPEPLEWRTPGSYTWRVPAGVTEVRVDIAGGSGGNRPISEGPYVGGNWGGQGGLIQGTLQVTPGQSLGLHVAAAGGDGATGGGSDSYGRGGSGYRSGGDGGSGSSFAGASAGQGGGGGGGASAVLIGGSPVVLAGGGGGAGGFAWCGGNPGGHVWEPGQKVSSNCASDGGDPGMFGVTASGHGENGENARSASGQGGGGGGGAGARGGGGADASTDGGGGGGGGTSEVTRPPFTMDSQTLAPRGAGYIVLSPVYGTQTALDHSSYSVIAGQDLVVAGAVGYQGGGPGGVPEGSVRLETGSEGAWTEMATVPVDSSGRFGFTCGLQCSIDVHATQLRAVYVPADTAHWRSSTATATLNVTKGATRTGLNVDPLPAVTGQQREFTASVDVQSPASGTATGEIEFWAQPLAGTEAELIGAAPLAANGQAVLEAATPFMGDHRVRAVYTGADWYSGSTSAWQTVRTEKAETEIDAQVVPSPSVYGQDYSVEVEVMPLAPGGGIPDGEVEISSDGESVQTSELDEGTASVPVPGGQAAGDHEFEVRYIGGERYHGSTMVVAHTIEKADVGLVLTQGAAESVYGESVELTVEASHLAPGAGEVSGEVEIWVDGEASGTTGELEGSRAELELVGLATGSHTLEARYTGSSNSNPAVSNEVEHVIAPAESLVALELDRSVITVNTDALLDATVAAATSPDALVTGTIEIVPVEEHDGEIYVGDPLATGAVIDGGAQFTLSELEVGEYRLGALYLGSANMDPAISGTQILDVVPAESTTEVAAPSSAAAGEIVELTAHVGTHESELSAGLPPALALQLPPLGATSGQWKPFAATGEIQFFVDGSAIGDPVPLVEADTGWTGSTVATITTTLAAGEHTIEARYTGEERVLPSSSGTTSLVVEAQSASDAGGGLASTGGEGQAGALAFSALLLGLGALTAARRRRTRASH